MTYWKTEHFKALQKAWYKRLEESGFQDAEEVVGDELMLRQTTRHRHANQDPLTRESKEDYFRILSQKVLETRFRSEIDRIILVAHSEGQTAKAICDELRRLGTPRFRHSVRFTIRKYETRWGIRGYSAKQLGKKVS